MLNIQYTKRITLLQRLKCLACCIAEVMTTQAALISMAVRYLAITHLDMCELLTGDGNSLSCSYTQVILYQTCPNILV